jgi:hypothetical protein
MARDYTKEDSNQAFDRLKSGTARRGMDDRWLIPRLGLLGAKGIPTR